MNKNQHSACQLTQQIEKDYISNMLGIDEQAVDQVIESHETRQQAVDFNAPYKKTDFECQIFNIAGLKIAVPTESISETIKQQQIRKNDNAQKAANLFVGTTRSDDQTINVIDLEYLLMNGIGDHDAVTTHQQNPVDIIMLKGSTAGFIGNHLVDQQTISKQHVHWRDAESERIWLAGTVARLGLVLLDIEGVIKLLKNCIK